MAAIHIIGVLFTALLLRNSASAAEVAAPSDGGGGGGGGGDGGGGGGSGSDWDMFTNGLQVMYGAYRSCEKQQDDVVTCLKLRALRSADRALRLDKVPLIGGMSFVKEEAGAEAEVDSRTGRRMAEPALAPPPPPPPFDEGSLPGDREGRRKAVDELLFDRLERFFAGHSLQMDTGRLLGDPGDLEEDEGDDADGGSSLEEGRRKKGLKKYGGALLLGLMMKGGLMAMAWKGVALMAGKALMVAKIALVLSAVVALKKLSSGGGGGHGDEKVTYEIVKHPQMSHTQTFSTGHDYGGHFDSSGGGGGGGGGGGHYKRSIEPLDAHDVVYHAHVHPRVHLHTRAPYPHLRLHHDHVHYPHWRVQQRRAQQLQQQKQQQPPLLQDEQQNQKQDYQYENVGQTQGTEDSMENQPIYPYPQQ